MINFIDPGEVVTYTAPSGGVVAGTAYQIGQILVVATTTVAQTLPFEGLTRGVVDLPKASGAWTEGALLYWDNTAHNVTTTSTSNLRIGVAARLGGESSGATTGRVRLTGAPAPAGA
jgi:predicted RecA/RadA family phage recombinase